MKKITIIHIVILIVCLGLVRCKIPAIPTVRQELQVPRYYKAGSDTEAVNPVTWKAYFTDPYLQSLIDTALANNRELLIALQEIEIARNEVRLKKGKIYPVGGIKIGTGVEKPGRYTSRGASDAAHDIAPGVDMPEPLPDFNISAFATWEVDIWKKLRNAKEAAVKRYLETEEGRHFVITNLVAEIAGSYYELLALDYQLDIVNRNIQLQKNALEIVRLQKSAARSTELAVQKFQAEVYKTESLQYGILQEITEVENRVNMLLSRFPQHIERSHYSSLNEGYPVMTQTGIPSQLLHNRPDLRKAEYELQAAALDVKVARAEFFPSFEISSTLGLQAFNPKYLSKIPQSLAYSLAGDLIGPLINRSAIKAEFEMASARQVQVMYDYEKAIVLAYMEVSNQLALIQNLKQNYELRSKQVDALNQSIDAANELFKYARADYLEVLMTQRDALEAELELVEIQKARIQAYIGMYKDLGGGWQAE